MKTSARTRKERALARREKELKFWEYAKKEHYPEQPDNYIPRKISIAKKDIERLLIKLGSFS